MSINHYVFPVIFNLDDAITSVKRLYKSSITEIKQMYVDDIDFESLGYWYKDAQEYIKQINKSFGALH